MPKRFSWRGEDSLGDTLALTAAVEELSSTGGLHRLASRCFTYKRQVTQPLTCSISTHTRIHT